MTKEVKRRRFSEFWDRVPRSKSCELREQICKECDITRNTFYFWKNGTTEIPLLACEKMNEIFGKKVFRL